MTDITYHTETSSSFTTLKHSAAKLLDMLYGTQKRTNRTLLLAVMLPIAAKALDMLVTVPYCGV